MEPDDAARLDRIWFFAAGLLVLLTPAITLVVIFAVLVATQAVAAGEITLVQAVELYLVEVGAFAVFGYLLYRLFLYAVQRENRAEDESPGDTHRQRERYEKQSSED